MDAKYVGWIVEDVEDVPDFDSLVIPGVSGHRGDDMGRGDDMDRVRAIVYKLNASLAKGEREVRIIWTAGGVRCHLGQSCIRRRLMDAFSELVNDVLCSLTKVSTAAVKAVDGCTLGCADVIVQMARFCTFCVRPFTAAPRWRRELVFMLLTLLICDNIL